MKGFFLPLLALPVLLGALFALFNASPVSAAVDPSSIQIVTDLKVTSTIACSEQDWTTDWINVMSNPDGEGVNNGVSYHWQDAGLQDDIEQAWANRSYSGVSQVFEAGSATNRIGFLIYFQVGGTKPTATYEDYGFTALMTNIGTESGSTGHYLYAFADADCEMQIYNAGSGGSGGYAVLLGQNSTAYPREAPYYANVTVVYPEGYDGEEIPGSDPANQPDKELRRPQFVYQLSDKAIKATPYSPDPELPDFSSELDEGYYFNGYYIGWNLWKCPGNGFDPVGQVCDGGTPALTDDQLLPVDQEYNYSVTAYGTYQVEAEYWVQQCYRYPSYPATPDYCFYSQLRAHFPNADYDYVNTYKVLTVDGRSETGDTKEMECNAAGFCQPATEICYELDSFIERLNCQMAGQLSVGLLNPSINAVKKLINGVVVPSSPTCNIPLGNITVVGQTIPLSQAGPKMCSSAQQVRNGFPVIPIVVNAMFALAILAFVINRVNRLLDNQKHDVLEKI